MTIADELKQLGQLHESGVINDEEFTEAKEKALSKASPQEAENDRKLYELLCAQHNGIAEFRMRLLALLPLASTSAILDRGHQIQIAGGSNFCRSRGPHDGTERLVGVAPSWSSSSLVAR